jgi:hypothetical protein
MLFERDIRYHVVESITYGVAQHNPYTWKVENDDFVREEELGEGAKFMDAALNDWILSLSEEQLHAFVDTFYQVICATQAQDLITLASDWKKSLNAVMAALKGVDQETVSVIKEIFKSLFEIFRSHMESHVESRMESHAESRMAVQTNVYQDKYLPHPVKYAKKRWNEKNSQK